MHFFLERNHILTLSNLPLSGTQVLLKNVHFHIQFFTNTFRTESFGSSLKGFDNMPNWKNPEGFTLPEKHDIRENGLMATLNLKHKINVSTTLGYIVNKIKYVSELWLKYVNS